MNRGTLVACGALLLGGLTGGAILGRCVSERCQPPSEQDKDRLINFVRLRYRLPPIARVGVADGGIVPGSCFRRLVFETLVGQPFKVVLVASPDFRFLTRDLIDALPDPGELAQQRRETARALVRGGPPTRGNPKARVTLAVFSDFQCPYCARLAKALNEIAASEGDRLRIVYRYFPLSIHPWAKPAAEAAACAARQGDGDFWSLHDFLFAHQNQVTRADLVQRLDEWAGATAALNRQSFDRCVEGSLASGPVEQDMALGEELGVNATPTVFLNGEAVDARSPDELRPLIRQAVETP